MWGRPRVSQNPHPMAVWRFREHRPDEKIRNPIQGEFFSEEAVERPAQALVREVIQNSLDARSGDASAEVEVRFTVRPAEALPEPAARFWLRGAWEHLRADGSGLRNVPEKPGPCRSLVIEDFGTSGLEGDPSVHVPMGPPSRLFAFFRAEGISQKGGKDGGRWGVGKTVFLRSSDLNTVFCLTVRRDDGRRLVFGQALLRYHWLGGRYFTPDGGFGALAGDVIVPAEDAGLAERLRADFGLSRGDEPGLSVVVPAASEELTGSAILDAVMREYFYPILMGRLVVTVSDPALGHGPRSLTADTLLDQLVDSRGPRGLAESVKPLAALALWLRREGLEGAVVLEAPATRAPEWSAAMFPAGARESLAKRFRDGETVLVKVSLTVTPVEGPPAATFFHVLLRRDLQDRGAAPAFVRNGIQIPKALERRVRGQSLWALVVIEDQPIATFLGDAETPAHTHWSKDTQNFKSKYRHGAATIDFVRAAPRFIAETLTEAARGRDYLSLVDFFPVSAAGEGRAAPAPRAEADADEAVAPEAPAVTAARPAWKIDALDGGFRVTRGPGRRSAGALSIAVAYDVARGNPLRRWRVADFDLAALPTSVHAARVVRVSGNELVVQPEGPRFKLEVTGFDPHRDLFLRVTAAEEPA